MNNGWRQDGDQGEVQGVIEGKTGEMGTAAKHTSPIEAQRAAASGDDVVQSSPHDGACSNGAVNNIFAKH